MADALYQLRQVCFAYPGQRAALEEVSLSIGAGERLVLLGANGSGKTTLLMLLAALQFPSQGDILFEGKELTHEALAHDAGFRRAFRRRVGVLFQNPDVQLFCPTVREEVAYGPLQALGREEALEKTEAALAQFRLEAIAGRAPHGLSGGEKRRVALAATLALDPEILLLDEPTSALDPRTCDELMELLENYLEVGARTLVTASHDIAAVRELGRTAVLLGLSSRPVLKLPVEEALSDEPLLLEANLVGQRRRSGRV